MARHMTAKQIKHFGTKRQKAALKAARSRKRTAKRTNRGHHSHSRARASKRTNSHRPRTKPRAAPRRKNPMEIISFLPTGNPARKRRKAVAATHSKKRRKKPASGHRRRNAGRRAKPHFARRRSRIGNPGKVMGWLTAGLSVIGGAVISKVATQFALGAKNTGVMGYGGNAVATAILGFAAHKLFRDKSVGQMVVAGGIAQIIVRMISDYTPYGQYLSGTGLGDYMVANWVAPQRLPDALSSAMVEIPQGWAPTTVIQSAAAGAGVGDLYGAPLY